MGWTPRTIGGGDESSERAGCSFGESLVRGEFELEGGAAAGAVGGVHVAVVAAGDLAGDGEAVSRVKICATPVS